MHTPRIALLSVMLTGTACVPKVEDDLSRVAEPRLLAVRSIPAEAAPAATISMQALVAIPQDNQHLDLSWSWCLKRKPLTELGAVSPECLDASDPSATDDIGSGLSVSDQLVSNACQLFGPTLPPPIDGQPSGRPVDPDLTGGYYQPFIASSSNGESALGNVRLLCGPPAGTSREALIAFNANYRRNDNPAIAALNIVQEGQNSAIVPSSTGVSEVLLSVRQRIELRLEWAACPRSPTCGDGLCSLGETSESCAGDCAVPIGCSGAESYVALDDSRQLVSRREAMYVSWYSSAGQFDERRTGVSEFDPDEPHTGNHWTAPDTPGAVHLWVVLRDDRGGVGWESYTLNVR